MDLGDELDDFDGGEDYDDGGEEGSFSLFSVLLFWLIVMAEISESDKGQHVLPPF